MNFNTNFNTNQIVIATVTIGLVGFVAYYNYNPTTDVQDDKSNVKINELLQENKIVENSHDWFTSLKTFFVEGNSL